MLWLTENIADRVPNLLIVFQCQHIVLISGNALGTSWDGWGEVMLLENVHLRFQA